MLYIKDIWRIVVHHYKPFRFGAGRKVRSRMVIGYAVLPILLATVLVLFTPIAGEYVPLILAVFSITAAVLTGLLAVVRSVAGGVDTGKRYDGQDDPEFAGQIILLQVLRDLYANLAYTVLLLVTAMLPLIVLQLLPSLSSPATSQPAFAVISTQVVCSWFVYFVGTSLVMSLLQTISGVYMALEANAVKIERELREASEGKAEGPSETGKGSTDSSESDRWRHFQVMLGSELQEYQVGQEKNIPGVFFVPMPKARVDAEKDPTNMDEGE